MITLSDIFSQDTAVNWLSQSYAEDRLPHGLIFSGPAGVGKATTARALAAVFLCERPKAGHPPTPCGKCPSCTIFATDNHPDFHVLYKELIRLTKPDVVAKEFSIDLVRDYLVTMRDQAGAAKRDGLTADQAVETLASAVRERHPDWENPEWIDFAIRCFHDQAE